MVRSGILPIVRALLVAVVASHPMAAPTALAQEQPPPVAGEVTAVASRQVPGTLVMPPREAGPPIGIVLLLHDSLGPDPRSAQYIDQLVGARIAVIDVQLAPADAGRLAASLAGLTSGPMLHGLRVGVLGFGAGALLAARLGTPFAGRALLYPGCDALSPPGDAGPQPVLLAHGDADPANTTQGCATAAARLAGAGMAVRHRTYPDAGYGWDHPGYGMEQRILLPRPDGRGRIPVAPWPDMASLAATQVAAFFTSVFSAGQ